MMTIDCKIEIDWIEDGGRIDDEIQGQIIEQVVAQLSRSISGKVDEMAVDILDTRVNAMIDEIWENFIEKRVNLTDKYGDTIETHDSIKDMLKARLDGFINQQVDKDGKPYKRGECSYNSRNRIDFLMGSIVEREVAKAVKEAERNFESKLKHTLDAKFKESISNAMLKNVDIDKIISSAKGGDE